jgi:hypothetical protein
MAAAETARLIASLELKDNLSKGVKSATASLGKLDTSLGKIGGMAQKGLGTAARNLAKIGAVAAVGVGAMVKSGIDSLVTLESAVASVDGAIDQMNLTVTGSQVATWANEIESAVGAAFDDKDIIAATENIIRYGKITEENLRPAMEVMTDLAAKTGSVESASELLGKALADPAKAAGKLSRYGIILTKTQQDQLKAMTEVGDMAGAQALLLEELARTTQGAAAASQGPYKRAMSVLADVTEDAQRALAEGFLPVLMELSEMLKTALADPKVVAGIRSFGQTLASGLKSLIGIAKNLPWAQIGDSLKLAGAGAKAVLGAFVALPPWVQTAVLTGWGLNKLTGGALGGIVGELGKGLIKGVLNTNTAVMNVKAGVVNGLGGLGGGKGGGLPVGGAAAGTGVLSVALAAGSVAAIGAAVAVGLFNVIPAAFRGPKGSSGPTIQNNTSPTRATEAVWNTIAQNTQKNLGATGKVAENVSGMSADIRNGFKVGATELRNGFVVNTAKLDAVKNATATGLSATAAAAKGTTSALQRKDMSPKVSVSTNVSTVVSVRAVTNGQTTVSAYNNRGTTNTWGGGR